MTLGWKVWLLVVVVVGGASGVLFYTLNARDRQRLIDGKVRASSMVTAQLAASLSAPVDFEDADGIATELEHVTQNREVLWAGAFADKGDLLAQVGDPARATTATSAAREEVRGDVVVVAQPIMGRGGKALGTAALVLTLGPENEAIEQGRASILRLCVLLGLGTATILLLLARFQVVAPLKRLAEAARRIEKSSGRLPERVGDARRDEIGELGRAFDSMSDAVTDREEKVAEAKRSVEELLDNMRQAIVAFDSTGAVVGAASKAARDLFGERLARGARVGDLLYPDAEGWEPERAAFTAWLEVAALASEDDWRALSGLAPTEATLEGRTFEIELRRLGEDRFMLLATDVTERRKLEAVRDRQSAEMAALRRAIRDAFVLRTFLDTAAPRVDRAKRVASDLESSEAFELVHMIRGEAAALDLTDVANAARDAEERLAMDRRGAPNPIGTASAIERLAKSIGVVDRTLGELSDRDRVPVSKLALEALEARAATVDAETAKAIRAVRAQPFGSIVATLGDRVTTWAKESGKEVIVRVEGDREPVPSELAALLPGVLVVLARNAVAHAVEAPADRVAAGKARAATLTLACEAGRVTCVDDGRGVAAEALPRIFDAGFTTAPDGDLAGRGMGLAAARRDLGAIGYTLTCTSKPGATTFQIARAS